MLFEIIITLQCLLVRQKCSNFTEKSYGVMLPTKRIDNVCNHNSDKHNGEHNENFSRDGYFGGRNDTMACIRYKPQ